MLDLLTDIKQESAIILLVDSMVTKDLVVQSLRGRHCARHRVRSSRLEGQMWTQETVLRFTATRCVAQKKTGEYQEAIKKFVCLSNEKRHARGS